MASEVTTAWSQSPRLVIMPVDDSAHSERAFNWYLKKSHRPDDKLILIHVIQPKYSFQSDGVVVEHTVTDISDAVNTGIKDGKKVLERYAERCRKLNYTFEKILRADSNPGYAIVKIAEEKFASMIVIANRGMSKARRTILGSCSHYVICHSGVPVLVVPPAKRSTASFMAEVKDAENL
ncbi:unnamed protein product [Hymenolepis diminuta]|uniref:Usp domain-containing protein n=1 Tax=Hymenolepis diminuta TaxID=6216 RepID=A0A0R3SW41_HYMDI|nr:unnamed protein product [Hymenolepis diminuta]VUZ51034.1 unnamed protein product [Hymenolepis diminuta]